MLTRDQKIACWLAMQDVPAVGAKVIKQLYDNYGSLERILSALHNSDGPSWWDKLRIALQNIDRYQHIIDKTYDAGGKICTLEDPVYPANLKKSTNAPSVLFYKGSLGSLSSRALALVGRVDPTEQGVGRAKKFARLCASHDIQVISGLARGIDTASHKAALDYAGITYAVIAHGIDHCYPPENKELYNRIAETGAVISQFPTGTRPQPWMFPARNETMCTISSGTVIIEATEKCGSLIQAQHSFRHGRRVFLLSANISFGTKWVDELLKRGALPVEDFEVVLKNMAEIKSEFKESKAKQISLPLGQTVAESITTYEQGDNKAILFDLDGVLFNSEEFLKHVYLHVCRIMGNNSPDQKIIAEKINHAPTYIFKCLKMDANKSNRLFNKAYIEMIDQYASFFPGVEEALAELKKKNYKIGIVTSQPLNRYKAVINKAPFKGLIDTAITWNDLTREQQKPEPDGILKALEMIHVKPKDAAYVGDAEKDIKAARNAGVKAIAVAWGMEPIVKLRALSPDVVLSEPQQISTIEL